MAAGDGDPGDGGQGEAEAGERADTPDSVKMTGSVTSSGTEADSAMSQVRRECVLYYTTKYTWLKLKAKYLCNLTT